MGNKNSWNEGPPRGVLGNWRENDASNLSRGSSGTNQGQIERQGTRTTEVNNKTNPLMASEPILAQPPDPATIPLPKGFIQVDQTVCLTI